MVDSEISMKRNNHSIVFNSRYYYHHCTTFLHEKPLLLLMAEGSRDFCYLINNGLALLVVSHDKALSQLPFQVTSITSIQVKKKY